MEAIWSSGSLSTTECYSPEDSSFTVISAKTETHKNSVYLAIFRMKPLGVG
jgi:hypothetical protein